MDNPIPNNFYTKIAKQYITDFKKNESEINELISEFLTGDINLINGIISKNLILNFRDSEGTTLIHCIINNDSNDISETQKLIIINELINRNVPLNAITNLNQNALHFAAINGYLKIYEFLIQKKCNEKLIDNMGNMPVHYLVDNFITECSKFDFYNEKNYFTIKNEKNKINKLDNIINLYYYSKIPNIINPNNDYIQKIKNIIKKYFEYKYKYIDELQQNYIQELENISKNYNISNKKDKMNNLFFKLFLDLKNIFNDIDIYSEQSDFNSNNINLMNEFTKTCDIINKDIDKINKIIDEKIYNNIFIKNSNFFNVVYLTYKLLHNLGTAVNDDDIKFGYFAKKPDPIYNNILNVVNEPFTTDENNDNKLISIIDNDEVDVTDSFATKIFDDFIKPILDNHNEYYYIYLKREKNVNNCISNIDDIKNKFTLKESKDLNLTNNEMDFLPTIQLEYNLNNQDTKEFLYMNPNADRLKSHPGRYLKDQYQDIINNNQYNPVSYNEKNIIEDYKVTGDDIPDNNEKPIPERHRTIYTLLNNSCIILNDYNEEIKNEIKNLNEDKLIEFILFWNKHISELIITCINNLVLLEKNIEKCKIPDYQENFKNILNGIIDECQGGNLIDVIKDIRGIYLDSIEYDVNYTSYKDDIETIFNTYLKILNNINNLNNIVNKYQTNKLLNSYKDDDNINNFYTNNIDNKYKFDLNFTDYKKKYFDDNLEISDDKQNEIIQEIIPFYNMNNINSFYLEGNDELLIEYINYFKYENKDEINPEESKYKISVNTYYKCGYNYLLNKKYGDLNIDNKNHNDCNFKDIKRVNFIINYNNNLNYKDEENIFEITLNNINDFLILIIDDIIENDKDNNIENIFNQENENKLLEFLKENPNQKKIFEETFNFIKSKDNLKEKFYVEKIKNYLKVLIDQEIVKEVIKKMNEINKNLNLIDKFKNNLNEINIYYIKQSKKDISLGNGLLKDIYTTEKYEITKLKNNKIINNKCYNNDFIESLIKLPNIDYKVLDINGNTIINRLINQYNYEGIDKIIKLQPILKTYKNYKNETPTNYLLSRIKTISDEYESNIMYSRIKNYGIMIENLLKNNNFESLEIFDTVDFVYNIIKSSIGLLSSVLWFEMLSFPNNFKYEDYKNIKKIFEITHEDLLINKWKDYKVQLNNDNNFKNKINDYKKILEKELCDLDNSIKQLTVFNDKTNNNINNVAILQNLRDKKGKIEQEIDSLPDENNFINNNINIIDEDIFNNIVNNFEIDWKKYGKNILYKLKDNYYKIIKYFIEKDISKDCISESLIKLLNLGEQKILLLNSDNNDINSIKNYYEKVITKVYGDYNDFDKYEDTVYNTLNNNIINILKINVINVIILELLKVLNIYYKENNINDKEYFKRDEGNLFLKQIKILFNYSMINKLDLKNPEKQYEDVEVKKEEILKMITLENLEDENKIEIENILDYYLTISDNLCMYTYEEMNNMLENLKRISLNIKMINILNS